MEQTPCDRDGRESQKTDSCDSDRIRASAAGFRHHPKKNFYIVNAPTGLTSQVSKSRDR
jgi:hypothetical protein